MGHRHQVALAFLAMTGGCDGVLRFQTVSAASDAAGPDGIADAAADGLDVPAGLVAYYPFDKLDSSYCAADATGDGYNGSCTQGTVRLVPGKRGMAYAFDSNASIAVADTADFDHGGFTVAEWLYLPSTEPVSTFDCTVGRPIPGSYGDHWSICIQPGKTSFTFQDAILYGPALPYDEWHHLALTWSANTAQAFFDGTKSDSQPATVAGSPDPIVIGSDIDPPGVDNFFPGYMDDLRLYSRALAPTEIAVLAN